MGIIITPLLRHNYSCHQEGMDWKEIKEITEPAFKKVRRWRVVIGSYKSTECMRRDWDHNMFRYFYELVFGVPIRELEVILWNLAKPKFGQEFMKPSQTFLLLTILRDIGTLTIREAALDEFLPRCSICSKFTQGDRELLFAYPEKSYKKLSTKLRAIGQSRGKL